MHQAALLLGAFSLLSQLIGLLRDRLLAGNLGPSTSLDVYYAAFKLPDFLYASFASLFSMTVLIPFITSIISKEGIDKAERINKFLNTVLSVYLLGMSVLCLVCFILLPYGAHLLVPGFSPADKALFVQVSRVLLLSPFFLGLSNLFGTFAQIEKKFFAFALSPVFYNIGILLGIIFLLPHFGIVGIVYGVVAGAILHFITHYIPLKSFGIKPRPAYIDRALVKEVVVLSIPRTIGLSLNSFSFLIISAVASLLSVGTLSIFQLSYNIQTTPLMIIGISYAVASFPALSELYAQKKMEDFAGLIHKTARMIILLSVPLFFLVILFRTQAVRILLGSGHFTAEYISITALCLAIFSISFAAQSLILVLVRGFYAMGETKTPLKINFLALFLVPIAIGIFLYTLPIAPGHEVLALAAGYSVVQIINAVLLWRALRKKMHAISGARYTSRIKKTLIESIMAGVVMFAVLATVLGYVGAYLAHLATIKLLLMCALMVIPGVILYLLCLIYLKNQEAQIFLEKWGGILKQKLKIS